MRNVNRRSFLGGVVAAPFAAEMRPDVAAAKKFVTRELQALARSAPFCALPSPTLAQSVVVAGALKDAFNAHLRG